MINDKLKERVSGVEREVEDLKCTLNALEDKTNLISINQGKIMSGMETTKWFIVIILTVVTIIAPFLTDKVTKEPIDLEREKTQWMMEMQLEQMKNQLNQ